MQLNVTRLNDVAC